MAKIIATESLEAVLEEVSEEVRKIMDTPPDREEIIGVPIFVNTMRGIINETFKYLPKGDRAELETVCTSCLCIGMILGKSPKLLVDILKRTKAKYLIMEEKEE